MYTIPCCTCTRPHTAATGTARCSRCESAYQTALTLWDEARMAAFLAARSAGQSLEAAMAAGDAAAGPAPA